MAGEIRKLDSVLDFGFVLDFFVHVDQRNNEKEGFVLIVFDESGKLFDELIFFDFKVGRYDFGEVFNCLAVKIGDEEILIVLFNEVVVFLTVSYDVGNGLLASD